MRPDFDVFISYAHANAQYAKDLVRQLELIGVRCTMDRLRLSSGAEQGWRGQLEDLISRSERFLVILTPESVTREEVFRECTFADSLKRPVHVVQVQVSENEPLPETWFPGLKLLIGPKHRERMISFQGEASGIAPKIKSWLKGGARKDPSLTHKPDFYVDRRVLSEHLAAQLTDGWHTGERLAILLSGPSGAGKSRLADEVCDALPAEIGVRRMREHSSIEHILPNDVLFVDGCLGGAEEDDRKSPGNEFVQWFEKYARSAPLLLLTSRHPEAIGRLSRLFLKSGHRLETHSLEGFTREEFVAAVKRIGEAGDRVRNLSDSDIDALFARTRGIPLCLQLIEDFLRDWDSGGEVHVPSASVADGDVCNHLVSMWQQRVARHREDWKSYLHMMSNIPVVGMDCHGAALCLEWKYEETAKIETELMRKGFLQRIDAADSAYAVHDLLRSAFMDDGSYAATLSTYRRRYRRAAEAEFLQHNGGPSKSLITLLDAFQVAGQRAYLRAFDDDFEDMGKNQASEFLRLLQQIQAAMGANIKEEDVARLENWFVSYVERTFETLKPSDCAVLLAIGPICERLPKRLPRLGDAFAPFWESGRLDDFTKINSALFPSLCHWGAFEAADKKPFIQRLVDALARQPWHKVSMPEMVAAGFACAIARLGEPRLAFSHILGNLVRGKGQPTAEACAGIILAWVNDLHDPETEHRIRSTIEGHRDFLRSLDPLVGVYLGSLNLPVGFEPSWGKVEFNPNRALKLAEWANNRPFSDFVTNVIDLCEVVKRGEPRRRSTISELRVIAVKSQSAAGLSSSSYNRSSVIEYLPLAAVATSSSDFARKSISSPACDEERSDEELPVIAAAEVSESVPEELVGLPETETMHDGEHGRAEFMVPESLGESASVGPHSAKQVDDDPSNGTDEEPSVTNEFDELSVERRRRDAELEQRVLDAQQRAYAEAQSRLRLEAEVERAIRLSAQNTTQDIGRERLAQNDRERNPSKKRGLFGWIGNRSKKQDSETE
jgi:hypothetical protein